MPAPNKAASALSIFSIMDLSDNTDTKDSLKWDTSPLTKMVWLNSLVRILQADKAVRELFDFGWVLIQSKTAVISVTQAKYLVQHPDVFFDASSPAPPFSIIAYETRRHELIAILDAWHASAAEGEEPPFHLQSYLPVNSRPTEYSSTPVSTLTAMGIAEDAQASLTDAEKLRFTISPEVIAGADRAAGILIANTITDDNYARQLLARHGHSGRTLIRRETAAAKAELSDDAAGYIHEVADLALRQGMNEISVSSFNRVAGAYIRLCKSVPDSLARSEGFMAETLASAVRRLSPEIRHTLQVTLISDRAQRNLWKTQASIRTVLGDY